VCVVDNGFSVLLVTYDEKKWINFITWWKT
jgi:hypothetical protein